MFKGWKSTKEEIKRKEEGKRLKAKKGQENYWRRQVLLMNKI